MNNHNNNLRKGGNGGARPALINTYNMAQKFSQAGFTDAQVRALVEALEEVTQVLVAVFEKMFATEAEKNKDFREGMVKQHLEFRKEVRFYALLLIGIVTFLLSLDIGLKHFYRGAGGGEPSQAQVSAQPQGAGSAEDAVRVLGRNDAEPAQDPAAPEAETPEAPLLQGPGSFEDSGAAIGGSDEELSLGLPVNSAKTSSETRAVPVASRNRDP